MVDHQNLNKFSIKGQLSHEILILNAKTIGLTVLGKIVGFMFNFFKLKKK